MVIIKNYILGSILILVIAALLVHTYLSSYLSPTNGYATLNETGNISSFNQIVVSSGTELIINQGNENSLIIETPQNNTSSLKVKVINNTLYLNTTEAAVCYLTVQNITSIEMLSEPMSMLQCHDLRLDNLTISINNGELDPIYNSTINHLTINMTNSNYTNFVSNLTANSLNINLNNDSGNFFVDGNTTIQTVNIQGSGNYTATNLSSEIANINLNGSGNVIIKSNILNAAINDNGIINYIGNPQITQQINGPGTIKQFNINGYINS